MPILRRPDLASWELPQHWVRMLMERHGLERLKARSLVRLLLLFHWSACRQFGCKADCKTRYLPCKWHPEPGIELDGGRGHVGLADILREGNEDFLLGLDGKKIFVPKTEVRHDYREGCACPAQIAPCRHELALQRIGHLGMVTIMVLATGTAIDEDEADDWLRKLDPVVFGEPPLEPGDGADRTSRVKDLLTMTDRADLIGPAGMPVYALRHPRDLTVQHPDADFLGQQAELGKAPGGAIVPAWEMCEDDEWDDVFGEETVIGRDAYEKLIMGNWPLLQAVPAALAEAV